MGDDYIETKSELTATPGQPQKKKKAPWWLIVIDVTLVIVFCFAIAVSVNVIYLTTAFGDAFFVDGMSMYPTLNKDGFANVDGHYSPLTWASSTQREGDLVDYGWAKMNDDGKNSLTRFDIVMTYFPGDGTIQDGKFVPSSPSVSLKIKRIIGMPGETVTIEDDGTAWGKTTIVNSEGTYVVKNLADWSDYPDLNGDRYSSYSLQTGTWTVPDGQFFVMGDNRRGGFSSDSRRVGSLSKEYIQGKAYVITALRKLEKQGDGSMKPAFQIDRLRMPWNYLHLDSHGSDWLTKI